MTLELPGDIWILVDILRPGVACHGHRKQSERTTQDADVGLQIYVHQGAPIIPQLAVGTCDMYIQMTKQFHNELRVIVKEDFNYALQMFLVS